MKDDKLIKKAQRLRSKSERKAIIREYSKIVAKVKSASKKRYTRIDLHRTSRFSVQHKAIRLFLLKNKGFKIRVDEKDYGNLHILTWEK